MRTFGRSPLAAAALALALVTPPESAADEAFEKRVRPVFARHCAGCHSTAGGKVKSDLGLDARDALLAGASSGTVVVPGKAAESLLIQTPSPGVSPHMPPKGRLSDQEIAALEGWVNALSVPTRTDTASTAGRSRRGCGSCNSRAAGTRAAGVGRPRRPEEEP